MKGGITVNTYELSGLLPGLIACPGGPCK
jgi:hypothetical protein